MSPIRLHIAMCECLRVLRDALVSRATASERALVRSTIRGRKHSIKTHFVIRCRPAARLRLLLVMKRQWGSYWAALSLSFRRISIRL